MQCFFQFVFGGIVCFSLNASSVPAHEEGVRWKHDLKKVKAISGMHSVPDISQELIKRAKQDVMAHKIFNEIFEKKDIGEQGINLFSGVIYLHFRTSDDENGWTDALPFGKKDCPLFFISGNRDAKFYSALDDELQKKQQLEKSMFFTGLPNPKECTKTYTSLDRLRESVPTEVIQKLNTLEYFMAQDEESDMFSLDFIQDFSDRLGKFSEYYNLKALQEKEATFQKVKEDISNFEEDAFKDDFKIKNSDNVHQGKYNSQQKKSTEWTHSDAYFLYRLTHSLNDKLKDNLDQYICIKERLSSYLEDQKYKDYIFDRALCVFHSTLDMCTRCTINMARQYNAEDGFVQGIQKVLESHNSPIKVTLTTELDEQWIKVTLFPRDIAKIQDIKINVIVGSREPYVERLNGNRRHVNYDGNDEIDLDDLWEHRQIVLWPIPTCKIFYEPSHTPTPHESPQSSASDEELAFINLFGL